MKGLRFLVSVDGGDETRFTVVRFSGEEAVSSLFSLVLQVVSDDADIAAEDIVGHDLRLRVLSHERDRETVYHGLATSFGMLHTTHGLCLYEIGMSSHLWPLAQTEDNRIFLSPGQSMDDRGTPLRDVLKDALTGTGASPTTFDFSGIQTDFSRRYVCQYRETHMHFVDRWLEYLGASYYFDHAGNTDRLVALDSGEWPRLGELPYREISGLPSHGQEVVWALAEHWQQVPAQVMIKDYNPDRPTVLLQASAPVSPRGHGTVYIYDDDPRSPEEARFLAGLRADALAACEHTLRGRATITGMRAGHVFSLREHPRQEMNKDYLVLRVVHRGSQAGLIAKDLAMDPMGMDDTAAGESSYRCEFSCIRLDRTYRPPRRTDWPEVIGTLNAKVDAAGSGEYAELDRHGRYKVIMPFDESGRSAAQASCFLRMAQPYAGSHNGMHFPLIKGTEVLVCFADGDPDRPYIHAAIPNPENRSPVTVNNQTQLVLLSLSQTLIRIEDQKGLGHIHFHCPVQNTTFQIGRNAMEGGLANPFLGKGSALEQGIVAMTDSDLAQDVSAGMFESVLGDRILRVHAGNYESSVASGYRSEKTEGNYTLTVNGNMSSTCGDTLYANIGQNRKLKVAGNNESTITDSLAISCQTYRDQSIQGTYTLDTQTGIALQSPKITWKSLGDMFVNSSQSIAIKADTLLEKSILKNKHARGFQANVLNKNVRTPINILLQSAKLSISTSHKQDLKIIAGAIKGVSMSSKGVSCDVSLSKVELIGFKDSFTVVQMEASGATCNINTLSRENFLFQLLL